MNKSLKSGAQYMTELCDEAADRRGVGLNRWLQVVLNFCKYQLDVCIKSQNESLLQADKCRVLYAEIGRILPAIEYCLAPKKESEKSGVSSLRSSGIDPPAVSTSKDEGMLDQNAKILYDWLDTTTVSRIRMLMNWQSDERFCLSFCNRKVAFLIP